MAELSLGARLLLTLLLLAASFLVWKRLQPPATPAQPAPKRSKKRNRKKSNKKNSATESRQESPPNEEKSPKVTKAAKSIANVAIAEAESDNSDSDDGRSAAEVLATRKFKPKPLGGARLAKRIKASLPGADVERFSVGQEVVGRFAGGERWIPAIVLELRKGNEYHLKYDDGEVEYRVPAAFIEVRPTVKSDDEADDKETKGQVPEPAAAEEVLDSESASSESEDDGWQVVGGSAAAKRQTRQVKEQAQTEPLVGGLTKRQRENRRKKERQREMKELLRQQAQKDDLDARARWRYAPS